MPAADWNHSPQCHSPRCRALAWLDQRGRAAVLLGVLLALLVSIAPAMAGAAERLITTTGVGAVQLGMTLDAARAATPGFILSESVDAVGNGYVAVAEDDIILMRLFAGAGDLGPAVDWQAAIVAIEVLAPSYRTTAGVSPQSSLVEVAQAYGPLIRIRRGEIDRQEYALFANQPLNLVLRVDGGSEGSEAGIYLPGTDMTERFRLGARIASITVQQAL